MTTRPRVGVLVDPRWSRAIRTARPLLAPAFALLIIASSPHAAGAGDPTAVGVVVVWTDTPLRYQAHFRVTNSKAHGPGVSIVGNYAVLGASANWRFEGTHDVAQLQVNSATSVIFKMKGEHLVAPHAGEAAPNPLPEITSRAVNLDPGKVRGISNWAGVDHPGEGDHIDLYSFGGEVRNRQIGATTSITSSVVVTAAHGEEDTQSGLFALVCFRWSLGALLTYDATTRHLQLGAGPLQVMDRVGCTSGSIDPLYAADPFLAGTLAISPLLIGPVNPDGSFFALGGDVAMISSTGDSSLMGVGRAPATIVPGETITLRLISGSTVNDTTPDETPVSPALADFASLNVGTLGQPGGTTGVFLRVESVTGDDIVAATEGFTQSVTMPVMITLGSLGPIGFECDSIDFNADTLFPDTADIDDYLSVFSGGPCSTGMCGDIDFNNDGLFPDTLDIDSLLSVFSGGACL